MNTAIRRLKSLQVFDVMSKGVVEVSADSTMDEVTRMFEEHNISSAPVVNERGDCIGIVSAADFMKRDAGSSENVPASSQWVTRYMTSSVRSITPQDPLLRAARVMCDKHLHRLPVIDHNNEIVGVISTMDVVAALVNAIDEMDATDTGG